jgi:hypothetical protein
VGEQAFNAPATEASFVLGRARRLEAIGSLSGHHVIDSRQRHRLTRGMTDAPETARANGPLGVVSGANLGVKFGLELASLAAFAVWGASAVEGPGAVVLAVAAPTGAATVWGVYAAPRAQRRLAMPGRAVLELGVFGLACAALAGSGRGTLAAVFGGVAVMNAGLMTALGQWER